MVDPIPTPAPVTATPKTIFASKTFWANVTALLGVVGAFFTGEVDVSTAVTGGVMALVNIILRFLVKQPIG